MTNRENGFITQLYQENAEKMYQLALRITGDRTLAEDVVEEAFLVLTAKVSRIIEHPNPVGWLFVTLQNIIKDELKKPLHKLTTSLELVPEPSYLSQVCEGLQDNLPHGLTDEEKKIIILFFEKGKKYDEIAQELGGITLTACRVKLFRAKKHCKELLLGEKN